MVTRIFSLIIITVALLAAGQSLSPILQVEVSSTNASDLQSLITGVNKTYTNGHLSANIEQMAAKWNTNSDGWYSVTWSLVFATNSTGSNAMWSMYNKVASQNLGGMKSLQGHIEITGHFCPREFNTRTNWGSCVANPAACFSRTNR